MKITKQVKKDRLEAKKFVESLRPDEKQYWIKKHIEMPKLYKEKLVYFTFWEKLLKIVLKKTNVKDFYDL